MDTFFFFEISCCKNVSNFCSLSRNIKKKLKRELTSKSFLINIVDSPSWLNLNDSLKTRAHGIKPLNNEFWIHEYLLWFLIQLANREIYSLVQWMFFSTFQTEKNSWSKLVKTSDEFIINNLFVTSKKRNHEFTNSRIYSAAKKPEPSKNPFNDVLFQIRN